jgi:hypothetical protein
LKLRFSLIGCLLGLLCACGSTNRSTSQTGGASTSTSTQANQAGVPQQPAANAAEGAPSTESKTPGAPVGIDACSLITTKEVAQTQGGAIKETKASQRADGEFLMSQCFYTADEFVRSVSLTVFQQNPATPDKQPREYFTAKFRDAGKKSDNEREREGAKAKGQKEAGGREEEEGEEGATAEPVSGIGEQAFWVKTGPSASLYVLKNNQFLILSIGGGDSEPVKLKKTRALAQQALKRLK